MKRDETVMIFNNEQFRENMKRSVSAAVCPPGSNRPLTKPGVVLTFAQQWSTFDSHLNEHLVFAIITPLKAVRLLEYFAESRGERMNSIDTSLNTGDLAISNASSGIPSNMSNAAML